MNMVSIDSTFQNQENNDKEWESSFFTLKGWGINGTEGVFMVKIVYLGTNSPEIIGGEHDPVTLQGFVINQKVVRFISENDERQGTAAYETVQEMSKHFELVPSAGRL